MVIFISVKLYENKKIIFPFQKISKLPKKIATDSNSSNIFKERLMSSNVLVKAIGGDGDDHVAIS